MLKVNRWYLNFLNRVAATFQNASSILFYCRIHTSTSSGKVSLKDYSWADCRRSRMWHRCDSEGRVRAKADLRQLQIYGIHFSSKIQLTCPSFSAHCCRDIKGLDSSCLVLGSHVNLGLLWDENSSLQSEQTEICLLKICFCWTHCWGQQVSSCCFVLIKTTRDSTRLNSWWTSGQSGQKCTGKDRNRKNRLGYILQNIKTIALKSQHLSNWHTWVPFRIWQNNYSKKYMFLSFIIVWILPRYLQSDKR